MPADKSHPLPVDTLLDGKFRVTKEIGRGGMAIVYEAENIDIGKRVAVKVLAAELVSSRTVTERFIREARAAAAIRSPYICDVYDVGAFEERPFLVMELLEGESLYDRLSRVRRLDEKPTVAIASQVAKGLVKAHEANIVHRDLKPENIFLTKSEDGEIVSKIVDFGLAKFYEPALEGGPAARLTKEGALFGTPAYMSPEQAKAQGEVDHRADLWALACIVYECLTGRTVWNVDQGVAMILAQIAGAPIPRPSRVRDDLPKSFDDWFLRALDRNPDKRFQTAREFSDSLIVALDPPEGSIKVAPIHTAEEGDIVDELVSADATERDVPPTDRVPPASPRRAPAGPVASDEMAALLPSIPPPKARGPGLAIGVLLAMSALALGGYGAWFYVLHPPEKSRPLRTTAFGPREAASVARNVGDLAETEPFALQIATAQDHLAHGQADVAAQLFKGAFDASPQSNAARSFYNHSDVFRENPANASCRATALGRPRAFAGSADASSIPTVALSPAAVDGHPRLVAGWAETDPATRRRFAYTTQLDSAFRRVTPVVAVTPEVKLVQQPSFEPTDDGLLLLYWDTSLDNSNVFLRKLDAGGSIAGAPVVVSPSSERETYPAITREPNGRFWIAWTQKDGARVSNIFARPMDANQKDANPKPSGPPARLTRYMTPPRNASMPSHAAVAIAHGFLNVAYSLERGLEHHIFALRVPLADPELAKGGLAASADGEKSRQPDRFLGQIVPVSTGPGQHNLPNIACIEAGCFVAWDDQKAGAHVAFFSGSTGEVIWRRDLGPKSIGPSVAVAGSEVVIAWYDTARLRLARLNRDGVGEPTVLGHVSGYQPSPNIIGGTKPGEWIVAWRDFEAGQHEGFVVRAECR